LRLSERRATNIGLLYPKGLLILGDIPVDVPPTKILGGCVPGIPGGIDASDEQRGKRHANDVLCRNVGLLQVNVAANVIYRDAR